jgi:hypothetical protein
VTPKVLFILKRRGDYNSEKHQNLNLSTGLYNSASFMCDMLNHSKIESKISVVVDNNSIDREVTNFKPTHVIIEALWVVPSKFMVLTKLHPKVKWIIRLHSEVPFLSNEGMAFDWIGDYFAFDNVFIGVNAPRALKEIRQFILSKYAPFINHGEVNNKIVYLPNFYPQEYAHKKFDKNKNHIDISCFGAIRPLKNHVVQAMGALKFAEMVGKKLHFHINTGRVEQKGDSILNNLQAIFAHLYGSGHRLINHGWAPREEFIKICANMDIGMQVSFSETFNIVAADLISQGVPIIGSREIPWVNPLFSASVTDSDDIAKKLLRTYNFPKVNYISHQYLLKGYTNKTIKHWLKFIKKTTKDEN